MTCCTAASLLTVYCTASYSSPRDLLHCSKLEIPSSHDSSPAIKSSSRPRPRARRTEDTTHDDTDAEVIFKTESGTTSSPRGRQSSPRRSPQKRSKTTVDDVVGPVHGGRKSSRRRSSTDRRPTQTPLQSDGCMPPPLLAAVTSTSSSRTPSPERPLPRLTAAVIPQHQLDLGFPEHQPDIVTDVLGWKLVPDEFLHQQPPPPSVVYGAHHLLRLFGKICWR